MTLLTATLPLNLQPQSRLLNLPTEIQHMITESCLVTNNIIEDPSAIDDGKATRSSSLLGLALLQTCQRLYYESDRRPLFAQNAFRFTTANNAKAFLKIVDHRQINDLEIDIRRLHADHPSLAREWLQYLAWEPEEKAHSSLRVDAPALKTLRLNFASWPRVPIFRAELWRLLRDMMSRVRDLERIVVIGASKGESMSRRVPWSPAHYVGADEVGTSDLIPRMWKCVDGSDGAKLIQWIRHDGKIYLEVASELYLSSTARGNASVMVIGGRCMEADGSCNWDGYLSLNSSLTTK